MPVKNSFSDSHAPGSLIKCTNIEEDQVVKVILLNGVKEILNPPSMTMPKMLKQVLKHLPLMIMRQEHVQMSKEKVTKTLK